MDELLKLLRKNALESPKNLAKMLGISERRSRTASPPTRRRASSAATRPSSTRTTWTWTASAP